MLVVHQQSRFLPLKDTSPVNPNNKADDPQIVNENISKSEKILQLNDVVGEKSDTSSSTSDDKQRSSHVGNLLTQESMI